MSSPRARAPAVAARTEETDEVTVLTCIGCGAIETPQPCLGTCIDRRLDFVPADLHADAVADLAPLREDAERMRSIVRELTAAPPREREPERSYRDLQAHARDALARVSASTTQPPPSQAKPVTTWACASCGRIEAPQPCIGVCIYQETKMIRAGAHDDVVTQRTDAHRQIQPLLSLVRRLAWVTPRSGHWEHGMRALRAEAEGLRGL